MQIRWTFALEGRGGIRGKASSEDCEGAEQPLFLGFQQVIAPANRVAQRLLSFRQIARAVGEQGQKMAETRQEQLGGQHIDVRGGQFQGERQSIQALANLGDRLRAAEKVPPRESGPASPDQADGRDRAMPVVGPAPSILL